LPELIAHFNTPCVPAVKKPLKTEKTTASKRVVEVDFSGAPKEFLFFNCHQVQKSGEFITLILGFADPGAPIKTVFRGVIWNLDLASQVPDLQKYIEKIGAPNSDEPKGILSSSNFSTAPIPFNQIGCASRGGWGEISIRQFSHKAAIDLKHPTAESNTVTGVTHGVYVSDTDTHKRLIYDLIIHSGQP
jgi:hypothetical protein